MGTILFAQILLQGFFAVVQIFLFCNLGNSFGLGHIIVCEIFLHTSYKIGLPQFTYQLYQT